MLLLSRHVDALQPGQCLVDRRIVAFEQPAALAAVRLGDHLLDLCECRVGVDHPGDGEEARLHDGVDAPAHVGLLSNPVRVDHVDLQPLVDDLLLHLARQAVPDLGQEKAAIRPVIEDCAGLAGDQKGACRLFANLISKKPGK